MTVAPHSGCRAAAPLAAPRLPPRPCPHPLPLPPHLQPRRGSTASAASCWMRPTSPGAHPCVGLQPLAEHQSRGQQLCHVLRAEGSGRTLHLKRPPGSPRHRWGGRRQRLAGHACLDTPADSYSTCASGLNPALPHCACAGQGTRRRQLPTPCRPHPPNIPQVGPGCVPACSRRCLVDGLAACCAAAVSPPS